MTGAGNDSTQSFAKTICSICYEDLKPNVEDLQAISICGHVFHELCIQQWFEYCSKGKKNCPICKQKCTASNVSRLYFQSAGDSNDSNLSQKLQTHKEDPNELKLEVRKLEGRINVLNSFIENQENDLKNIRNELCECNELLKKESSLKNEALEQTRTINLLLNMKTHELKKLDSDRIELQKERIKLQERNMALAKELAEQKLASDLDLDGEEIVKLASLGTVTGESVGILKKSLVARNMLYKELLSKYIKLGGDEALFRKEVEKGREFEKAKEQLEKVKKKNQKLEAAKELKDNGVMSTLNVSKKTKKSSSVLKGVDPTFSDTFTPQDTIRKHDITNLRKTKRSRVSENINESNNEDGVSSYILIDDDEAPKVLISPKSSSYDSVPQPTKRATTDAAYLSKSVHETSEHDRAPCHDRPDDEEVFFHETKEASLPGFYSEEADFSFSAGVLGPDGTKRHLGSWCRRGQSKGFDASLMPAQRSGDLIAVGADGRGGNIKVLKSGNPSSLNSRGSFIFPKSGKSGVKASSSQSRGSLQIDHFFSKAGQ
ncbi:hypothetical protein SSX86_004723 [Deinandra increscens subsp. villosa]|uniref:RING-type domain-containing protein n=1 Tax=Deinandra increscens subsp. villosa TaxID=3103831 RepID=A0AAP0DSH2_9ASTR